ncbi:hypothetical protein ACFL2S_10460 [Thermodesulfobacteriota bacterium]
MYKESKDRISEEKRTETRRTQLRNYRVEIKPIGEPIYQFRVTDVGTKGAGILIKEDSDFLSMIKVGQIVDVEFIFPKGTAPSGNYKAEIKHITKPGKGKNDGHCLVGILILQKIE